MKHFKQSLSIFLVLVMMLTIAFPASAATTTKTRYDVPGGFLMGEVGEPVQSSGSLSGWFSTSVDFLSPYWKVAVKMEVQNNATGVTIANQSTNSSLYASAYNTSAVSGNANYLKGVSSIPNKVTIYGSHEGYYTSTSTTAYVVNTVRIDAAK